MRVALARAAHSTPRLCPLSSSRAARAFSTTPPRAAASTPPDKDASKAFASTLLLPATPFPLYPKPETEGAFRAVTSDALYRWQAAHNTGAPFIVHDGPPYANGAIHMGHALNKIIKDIVARFHVSQGRRVHYVPGWDCHGLPIENKVLEQLGDKAAGMPPSEIRARARAYAEGQIESQKAEFRQLGVMADWDNPDATYRTLEHAYEIRQLRIFQKMVANGLIYRAHRPVHYSPSSRSALAEAELTYADAHVSHSVYVAFAVDGAAAGVPAALRDALQGASDVRLLVWTTTPWTLSANMAIAANPELVYAVLRQTDTGRVVLVAKDLVSELSDVLGPTELLADVPGTALLGLPYKPLFSDLPGAGTPSAPLRVIPAAYVTATSGTGLVHTAPAHGAEDYAAFRALSLLSPAAPLICHVDDAGAFDAGVLEVVGAEGRGLVGQAVLGDGGRAMAALLKRAGVLVKAQRIKHRYPYDWKTKQPIIMRATSQWFADLGRIKEDALAALSDVHFHPAGSRNRLEAFVRARSEWCISRQRVWGLPIPALYRTPASGGPADAILTPESIEHIVGVLEDKGVEWWWAGPVEDFVPPALRADGVQWARGTDTLDVWFDSGVSWAGLPAAEGAEGAGAQGRARADVCVEGSDQHRGWFQSMLLTAVSAQAEPEGTGTVGAPVAPYRALLTHGMVLDEAGKKMSKSVGNIVSPITVIAGGPDKKKEPAYGAATLRLWAAGAEHWRDMALGPRALAGAAEALRKVRNSARFMLGNIGSGPVAPLVRAEMSLADRYTLHELWKLEQTALAAYPAYNFPKVVNALSNFANVTLSAFYLDIVKDCLYADARANAQRRTVVAVMDQVLTTMTHVLAPILPHLAEEIHWARRGGDAHAPPGEGPSFFMQRWEPLAPEFEDTQAERDMGELLRVRTAVLGLLEQARGNKQLRSSLEAEVDLILPNDIAGSDLEIMQLLQREEGLLKTLFIVSDAALTDEGSLGTSAPEWAHVTSLSIPGSEAELALRVRPAERTKCPRCWTYTREAEETLCARCTDVVRI